MTHSIDIIFAEFGPSRANAGDATLPGDRLEPSLSSFKRHFPEASVVVYTDQPWESTERYRVVKVDPPFDRKHPRYGNRANDWGQPYGALQSKADIVMWADSDLLIVNDDVRSIITLTELFGLCAPPNGRYLLWRDAASPLDGGPTAGFDGSDETRGCDMCHCTAFMSLWTRSDDGRDLLRSYCDQLIHDAEFNRGARGPLSFGRAVYVSRLFPYTLPREFCITGSNLGDVESRGRTVPIILHVGHETVRQHYRELVEKWS